MIAPEGMPSGAFFHLPQYIYRSSIALARLSLFLVWQQIDK